MTSTRTTSTATRLRRLLALTLALLLLPASAALAHPFIRGGEAPVDSLARITLAMAHGCGDEASGQGDPTTDVSLEVPAWLRIVDVPSEDGWVVELEAADDGRVEVVTWTADGAVEPAPDFDLDVVVTGEVGDERFLRVFQACDGFAYRWIGTPDEPADDPAVRLVLAAADPDNPAPPEPEPEPAPAPDEATDEATDDPGTPDSDEDAAAEDAAAEDAAAEDVDDSAEVAPIDEVEEDTTDDGGRSLWWLLGLAAVMVAGLAIGRAMRRGTGARGTDGGTP